MQLRAFGFAWLLSLALVAATPSTPPQRRTHQTWQTENGLPQNSVHAVAQTSDGYIWVGTEGGLARFNGLQFTTFDSQTTPNLHSNKIQALLEDRSKSLWIATSDGLTRLSGGRFTVFTTEQGLPVNNVWSLFEDLHRQVWAITSEGAAVFRDGRFSLDERTRLSDTSLTAVAQDRKENIWLGTEHGLRIAHQSQLSVPLELSKVNVQALLIDSKNRLWVGTADGLFLYANERVTALANLPDRGITTLYEDRRGNIWVGAESGIAEILGGDPQKIAIPAGMPASLTLSFLQDREGNIWAGTDSAGLTVSRDEKFRTYGRAEGIPDGLLRCVFEDRRHELWLGTNGHGLIHLANGKASTITAADGLSSNVILSLAEDGSGSLLIGTPDGLNTYDGGSVSLLTSADGLPDDFVRSLYRDPDGSAWIGTRRGLAHRSAGRITVFTSASGLPSDLVGSVLRSRNGCLWIATLRGLVCLVNGRINRPAVPNVAITSLYEDSNATLWVGTATDGLIRLAGNQVVRYPPSLGLPKTIFGIAEDSHGQLWITSPNGLVCVRKNQLDDFSRHARLPISVTSYGTADGLSVNEFGGVGHPTIWKDAVSTLWFVTAKGLLSIDAIHAAPNLIPPSVVLEAVSADDRVLSPAAAENLAPDVSRIAFDYVGLSFISPQKVRYRYRLEGFDRDWIEAGARRVAYYTNLNPGHYRFTVLARNSDGIWSNAATAFSFHLRPHFYQTIWFYIAAFLLLIGIFYSAYRWRVKQVQTQFSAVLAERTRIAREIHDTLAQGFVAVSIQLELIDRLLSTSAQSARGLLLQTRTLVQQNLAEARRSIWDLRAGSAGRTTLPARLFQSVRDTAANTGLKLDLTTTGAYRALPERIEDELLKIGGEAVVNVVRHAAATHLQVTLAYDSTKAHMTISDNGRGFLIHPDSTELEGHYGLRGMRERASAVGALLKISSSEREGTQICVEVNVP